MTTKLQATCDALGNPTSLYLTPGHASDLVGADALLLELVNRVQALLADRAYDAHERVLAVLEQAAVTIVIPPKAHRRQLRWRDLNRTLARILPYCGAWILQQPNRTYYRGGAPMKWVARWLWRLAEMTKLARMSAGQIAVQRHILQTVILAIVRMDNKEANTQLLQILHLRETAPGLFEGEEKEAALGAELEYSSYPYLVKDLRSPSDVPSRGEHGT